MQNPIGFEIRSSLFEEIEEKRQNIHHNIKTKPVPRKQATGQDRKREKASLKVYDRYGCEWSREHAQQVHKHHLTKLDMTEVESLDLIKKLAGISVATLRQLLR